MNESKIKAKPRIGLLFLMFFCSLAMMAQERTISGVVNDTRGEPVIGASGYTDAPSTALKRYPIWREKMHHKTANN